MPLYYFDLTDGARETDEVGLECETLDLARSQAVKYAGELLQQNANGIWDGHDLRVEVFSADRKPLFAVITSTMSFYPAS